MKLRKVQTMREARGIPGFVFTAYCPLRTANWLIRVDSERRQGDRDRGVVPAVEPGLLLPVVLDRPQVLRDDVLGPERVLLPEQGHALQLLRPLDRPGLGEQHRPDPPLLPLGH